MFMLTCRLFGLKIDVDYHHGRLHMTPPNAPRGNHPGNQDPPAGGDGRGGNSDDVYWTSPSGLYNINSEGMNVVP